MNAAESMKTAIVPVVKNGIPILLSYYFNEKDFEPFGKPVAVGSQTTALSLIMMNPLWMGADYQLKKEIAQKAVLHGLFSDLTSQIDQALRTPSITYLDASGSDQPLYKTASQIAQDIYDGYISNNLKKKTSFGNTSDRPEPYFEDGSGQNVEFYNPYYIFYCVGFFDFASVNLKKNHLMNPRPLKWGFIPYIGDNGKSSISLNDGSYSIVFYKGFKQTDGHAFDFSHPAGLATGINVCTGALNIVSVVWDFGDLTRVLGHIPALLSGGKLAFDAVSTRDDFADQDAVGQIGVLIIFIGSNIDEIVKLHISNILKGGNASAATVAYFRSFLPMLKNVSLPLKVIGAATKVPFFVDVFAAPSRIQYNVSSTAGVLKTITAPANTAPTASFTVTPTNGTTQTDFLFDASGCSDAQDPVSALQVRWDWDNNGSWDTQYSTNKTTTHRFSTDGTKMIKMEVKDTGDLINITTRQMVVTKANTSPMIPTQGLVAYYPFSGSADDKGGYGYHGSTYNVTLIADRFNQADQAYAFNGTSSYITTTLDVQPKAMPTTTWSFWFNSSGTYARQHIIGDDDGNFDRTITLENDLSLGVFNGSSNVWTPVMINKDKWYHCVITYTPNNMFLYVNNVKYTAGYAPEGGYTLRMLTFGSYIQSNQYYFSGKIDDIRIYNRELTEEEVYALYHEGGW